jgi:surface antigen
MFHIVPVYIIMMCYYKHRSPFMHPGIRVCSRLPHGEPQFAGDERRKRVILQSRQQVWNFFQQLGTTKRLVKGCVAVILVVLFLGMIFGLHAPGAHAQGNSVSTAQSTSHASISRSSSIHLGNQFPWPSCTWWANQRYRQMHGTYVPWRTNSNAWQWTARAYNFHWRVYRTPNVGWIMDLQPWVQGAYGLGHVGVVEKVLRNGYFVASSMSWGAHPTRVTYWTFHAGNGVTFLHQ